MSPPKSSKDWRETGFTPDQQSAGWLIALGIIALVGLFGLGVHFFTQENAASFWANLCTSAIGIVVTVMILDALARAREGARTIDRLKDEVGSPDNGTALRALDGLRRRNIFALCDQFFYRANLQNANLSFFDSSRVHSPPLAAQEEDIATKIPRCLQRGGSLLKLIGGETASSEVHQV